MHKILSILFLAALVLSGNAYADASRECYEKAMSQIEMDQCAEKNLEAANSELDHINTKLKEVYKEDRAFLEKLTNSQRAWEKLRTADFELRYPHVDEPYFYGSVFTMCEAEYKAQLTLQRVEFLKQWLIGSKGGDICRGSQVPQSYLQGLLGNEYGM